VGLLLKYLSAPHTHLSLPVVHRSIAQRGCGMPIQAYAYSRSRTIKSLYTRLHSVRMGDGLLLVAVTDGSTFMTSRYDIHSLRCPWAFLSLIHSHQERQKIWSWLSEHQKRAVFEMTWQQHGDSINRVAIALQSHKVGLIDLTRIPAVKKSRTTAS
jgi:hypothetical protein